MRGLHHVHLRKRRADQYEPFPARNPWLRFLDRFVLVVGVVGPLTAIPQVLKIYTFQDASGVSLISWALPALFDIPWIIYGYVHHDRPILVCYSLWLITNSLVAIGVIMYGGGFY